jgi:chemotaxis protein MotA
MSPASQLRYLHRRETQSATAESFAGFLFNQSQKDHLMDKSSIGGVFLAVAGIVAGLLIEGGNVGQILQPTAALIVFGGTMGAVLLQFPLLTVLAAFRSLGRVFAGPKKHNDDLILQLVSFANKARRNGVVSLDSDMQTIEDPFLRQTLMLAVDGTEPNELRKIMRVSLESTAESEERLPAVFEAAGGFSPTIGILGAVLGLIQVMQHLDNIQEVGRGIAVAFVATIYGVGLANLFFLPFAGKMRIRIREEHQRREMMLEGVTSILEGINPRMLEVKLSGYIDVSVRSKKENAA